MALSQKHYLFQVNRHVQASIMFLSIMDSAELDFNSTLLSSASSITSSNPDDYDKGLSQCFAILFKLFPIEIDLRLAAELGRYLLERNHELESYINVLQKELDDKKCDMKVRLVYMLQL